MTLDQKEPLKRLREMLRYAKPATLGEVIVSVNFPEKLREREKVTGFITIGNPFPHNAGLGCVVTDWTGVQGGTLGGAVPHGRATFSYPADFIFPPEVNATYEPPPMPRRDVTLLIKGAVVDWETKEERMEERTVTIKLFLEWWEQAFLGVPVWGWLAGGVGAVALVGGLWLYTEEREREARLFMSMMKRR